MNYKIYDDEEESYIVESWQYSTKGWIANYLLAYHLNSIPSFLFSYFLIQSVVVLYFFQILISVLLL